MGRGGVHGAEESGIFLGVAKLRETKTIYFLAIKAEGSIEIFRVVRLRGTTQMWFLNPEAERNIAHIIIGQRG